MLLLNTNCLLVIDEDSPLNFALEMLLTPGSGVVAVKSNAGDFQDLVDEVCSLQSQVVILEDAAPMTEKNSLAHLLLSNPELKIIVVLRESNTIHVFRKDEIVIQKSSDLIDAIQLA
jgi:hypothetical protein